jgi:hypothetical protein
MKNVKVIAYPQDINDNDLSIYSQGIYDKCSSNPAFASLTTNLTNLNTRTNILNTALRAQKKGDASSTSNLRAASDEVKRELKLLASNVEYISKNDEALALSSGFSIQKPNVRDAKTFNAKQGKNTGTVDLEINSYGKAAYVWEMSPDPIGQWTKMDMTLVSKTTITCLTPGVKYWFRVTITTNKRKYDPTDPHFVLVV